MIEQHSLKLKIKTVKKAVNWNGNSWALKCDFPGNDLISVQAPGEQCGDICYKNQQCTHYSHTNYNGGTCWLKKGSVTKQNAIDTNDWSSSCGVIREATSPVTDNPVVTDGSIFGNNFNNYFF